MKLKQMMSWDVTRFNIFLFNNTQIDNLSINQIDHSDINLSNAIILIKQASYLNEITQTYSKSNVDHPDNEDPQISLDKLGWL